MPGDFLSMDAEGCDGIGEVVFVLGFFFRHDFKSATIYCYLVTCCGWKLKIAVVDFGGKSQGGWSENGRCRLVWNQGLLLTIMKP
jgi:hypothetical protein